MNTASRLGKSETVIFLGAGATAKLDMPPTNEQAGILYYLCDKEITADSITAKCFEKYKKDIANFLNILDFDGEKIHSLSEKQKQLLPYVFPELSEETALTRLFHLRRVFDWPALKQVAKILKQHSSEKILENYLQNVYDFIDVLLRENRGFSAKEKDGTEVFYSSERLRAGRELLIYLMNTMFACAWQKLIDNKESNEKLTPYKKFCDALAVLMGDEAEKLSNLPLNQPSFYKFSYSILTTNFEPIFLWLIYQAHKKYNKTSSKRIGNPGKRLQLMIDFPNTLAMRNLSENERPAEDELNNEIWYPVTSAVAQRLNDEKHISDRVVRIGKYYFVHGSCNFRHCPKCGRLTLSLGDSWDENSQTLFTPGLIEAFSWNTKPRTDKEKAAYQRGEYDAIECPFCGQLTYAHNNFMHTQTHFKGKSPSFIKEITDEALASLPSVKHVVLLGYSFPTDDMIWTTDFKAMLECNEERKVYCSVICGYDGTDTWKYGEELDAHLALYKYDRNDGEHGIGPIMNAIGIFGKENVRAYTGGIPQVFHNGDKSFIREMLYPNLPPWDKIGFSSEGIVR